MEVIETIHIEEEKFAIYLDADMVKGKIETEIGISTLPIGDETVMLIVANMIAEFRGARLRNKNFGGTSSGNPPNYGYVFFIPLKRCLEMYTASRKRKVVEKELKEAKEKLIDATRDLMKTIKEEVKSILQRLPEYKRETDLKKIKEMVPPTKKDSAIRIELDPTRKDSAVESE